MFKIMQLLIIIVLYLSFLPNMLIGQGLYYWGDKRKISIVEDKSSLVLIYKENAFSKNKANIYSNNSSITDVTISPDQKMTVISFKEITSKNITQTVQDLGIDLSDLEWFSYGYKYIDGNFLRPTNRISFLLKAGLNLKVLEEIADNKAVYDYTSYGTRMLKVIDPSISVVSLANEIFESGVVDYCQPDFIANIVTNIDPLYADQYYLNNTGQFGGTSGIDIDAPEAWQMTLSSSQIKVAVIDEGCENHEDLYDSGGLTRVLSGFTPHTGGTGTPDGNQSGHGVCCSGEIVFESYKY